MKRSIKGNRVKVIGTKRYRAEFGIMYIEGNTDGYFFLNGEIHEKDRNDRWVETISGACGNHLTRIWPDLQPFETLHLWQEDLNFCRVGNAEYYARQSAGLDFEFGKTYARPEDVEAAPSRFAEALLLSKSEAETILPAVVSVYAPYLAKMETARTNANKNVHAFAEVTAMIAALTEGPEGHYVHTLASAAKGYIAHYAHVATRDALAAMRREMVEAAMREVRKAYNSLTLGRALELRSKCYEALRKDKVEFEEQE